MWGYVVGGFVSLFAVAISAVVGIGGWQARERRSLHDLADLDAKLPHGHPAKDPLRQHIEERMRLFANRSLEPTPLLAVRMMYIALSGALVAAVVSLVQFLDTGENRHWVLAMGACLVGLALLTVLARAQLRLQRIRGLDR